MTSSHRPDHDLEAELRDAFHAAAGEVHPRGHLATSTAHQRVRAPASAPRRALQRWLVPGLAAAAVAAIALPVAVGAGLFGPGDTHDGAHGSAPAASGTTAGVTQSDGWATVAGVRFPLPPGWDATATARSTQAIAVCVAEAPSTPCAGVSITVAIPRSDGSIVPVPDPVSSDPLIGISSARAESAAPTTVTASAGARATTSAPALKDHAPTCPRIVDTDPLDGRAAMHYSIGPCTAGSAQSNAYYVTDGSVAITTPRGQAAREADQIAAGIDFSRYAHDFGPQVAFLSGSNAAVDSSSAGIPATRTASAMSVATATSVESPGASVSTARSAAADSGSPGVVFGPGASDTAAEGSMVSTAGHVADSSAAGPDDSTSPARSVTSTTTGSTQATR